MTGLAPPRMLYWIDAQFNACSSSEVASMIEDVLQHDTKMNIEKQDVDTHGRSEVDFAFCQLLGFQLPPNKRHAEKHLNSQPWRDAAFKSGISRSTPGSALNPMAKKHQVRAVQCADEKTEKRRALRAS